MLGGADDAVLLFFVSFIFIYGILRGTLVVVVVVLLFIVNWVDLRLMLIILLLRIEKWTQKICLKIQLLCSIVVGYLVFIRSLYSTENILLLSVCLINYMLMLMCVFTFGTSFALRCRNSIGLCHLSRWKVLWLQCKLIESVEKELWEKIIRWCPNLILIDSVCFVISFLNYKLFKRRQLVYI